MYDRYIKSKPPRPRRSPPYVTLNAKENTVQKKTKEKRPHSGVYCGGNLTGSSNPLNPLSLSNNTGVDPIPVDAPREAPTADDETSDPDRGRSARCVLGGKMDVEAVAGTGPA